MSADTVELSTDSARALTDRIVAGANSNQAVFRIALLVAALGHIALIIGITNSPPRHVGNPGGRDDAINVEIVDAADLQSRQIAKEQPASAPPTPASPAQAAQRKSEPQAEAQEQKPEPKEAAEAQQQKREPQKTPAEKPAETPQDEAVPDPTAPVAFATPALPALDDAQAQADKKQTKTEAEKASPKEAAKTAKAEEPPPKPEEKPKQKAAAKPAPKPPEKLDLDMPFDVTARLFAPGSDGGESSATRPPGITRSGENDRFGRDVIRSLRRTMPAPDGFEGRVTVRIILSETGNKADVKLLKSGGNTAMDEQIIFSVHQTAFPFPPNNATLADRTFRITYVYR